MKFKKNAAIAVLCVLGIAMISKIAYAKGSVGYNFSLPTYGSRFTDSVTKDGRSSEACNEATYIGWSGSTINCWVKSQETGGRLTSEASYTGTGNVRMYYGGNLGSEYYGHSVSMGMKTSPGTLHPCDAIGKFHSNY
ncbi:hypothetical protein BD780_004189 [Clostridium tetanomorphum]|uniref:Uncharacterized protein n=1 Tax=Clostridium tetanomorphum TaxID=1553 RepID=A0A923J2X0_CLOTT|nr:hypothetical protein [Clostridium tetanomorphum]MBC2399248.1 hypothetical protein [Clostridium tetanomorphum]MBP1862827.1 hypothetical protein [Clostridium tetanomorphum]NRS86964.1 hypothetical protein [Clostridium tetanomorphum]NRZ99252.1 hypothetical protein [Clostridium tetanomorphum]SQC00233.1 Uncharacterised protein [Clostridium tetanomorphum]